MRRLGYTLLVVGAVLFGVLQLRDLAVAQTSGEVITFLLPAAGNQPEPPVAPTDKLIITGGRITTNDATSCGGPSAAQVQNAVLVDPGPNGRSGRILGVILYRGESAAPATKLQSLAYSEDCTVGGTAYKKYTGTVE